LYKINKKSNIICLLIALIITAIFSIRYLNALPFSEKSQLSNIEMIATSGSYFIYVNEEITFPIGVIKKLTFPYEDANIGNVGAIPLFAIIFKILSKFIPKIANFDYFILINITSVFLSCLYTQKILILLNIESKRIHVLGALVIGTSFILLNRMQWTQPFNVIAYSLYLIWIYLILSVLHGKANSKIKLVKLICIYPTACLLDNYSLFAILSGTALLILQYLYDFLKLESKSLIRIIISLVIVLVSGAILSIFSLYIIGMYPLPKMNSGITSYDFGMGGRYHVANLFSLIIPIDNEIKNTFLNKSLISNLIPNFTTDILNEGQAEGASFIGTTALLIWIYILFIKLIKFNLKRVVISNKYENQFSNYIKIKKFNPWNKIIVTSLIIYILSLGYELNIYHYSYPNFSLMPAALIADNINLLYNFRAPGRWSVLLMIVIIIEGLRQLFLNINRISAKSKKYIFINILISMLCIIHIIEILPFLKPVETASTFPINGWDDLSIKNIKKLSINKDILLIAPSWQDAGREWWQESFALAYYSGLKTNIYQIARTNPSHDKQIYIDRHNILNGEWDGLVNQYGDKIIIAIPIERSDVIRQKVINKYTEFKLRETSLWVLK